MSAYEPAKDGKRHCHSCEEETLNRAASLLQEALSLLSGSGPGSLPTVSDDDRLIRLPEVLRLTGMCRSALYDQMSRGQFPRSVKIGPRAASWSARAVHSWISDRIAE
ncbi:MULTISPECIES: AlpA family transcriptional regulator [unclassified Acidovorax]|uniref:helix-turn-helix transcriptional regulator n=1 Tax=unclassified Acidovorax TaxID=2684926 RepID=UPI001C473EF6|nr:AlpA family transcriptional regulator [Acidovorax sp. sif0732]MBV7448456.1 AlpA family transcriptional regulator [Acidovorax sp. sif0715]